MRRYAWRPRIVSTWRRNGSRAIIWLQSYVEREDGHRYCGHLGYFSYEFSGPIFPGFR